MEGLESTLHFPFLCSFRLHNWTYRSSHQAIDRASTFKSVFEVAMIRAGSWSVFLALVLLNDCFWRLHCVPSYPWHGWSCHLQSLLYLKLPWLLPWETKYKANCCPMPTCSGTPGYSSDLSVCQWHAHVHNCLHIHSFTLTGKYECSTWVVLLTTCASPSLHPASAVPFYSGEIPFCFFHLEKH